MNTSSTIPETGGVEVIPGYFLANLLGRGGYGEVWRAFGPGGFQVALKFVSMDDACGAVELKSLEIIRDIRHPNLLLTFASWQIEGWLIIGMELADKTLMDVWRDARARGLPGIPRDELLGYFAEAARGIDFLNEPRQLPGGTERFAIQHRDIKPQNILLVGDGIKVADFGLARVMTQGEVGHSGKMTPNYAAPEFFKGQTTNSSDQYCLAMTYCMMRSGRLPIEGKSVHEIITGHLSKPPDLTMLPKCEREIVARALAKTPSERWPSCRVFIRELTDCDKAPAVRNDIALPANASTEPMPETLVSSQDMSESDKNHATRSSTIMPTSSGRQGSVSPALPEARLGETINHELRSWVIGRDQSCDLVVNENAVSARHCRLIRTIRGYYLEDLGSSNGSYVNGYLVSKSVHIIQGDKVTLGRSVPMPWPKDGQQGSSGPRIIRIGRDAANDIVLDYPMVSGHHARIVIEGGTARIEDLGSTNGIAIGAEEPKVKQASLKPQDTVYFGSLSIPAWKLLQEKVTPSKDQLVSLIFSGTPIVIGRDCGCDVVIDLPIISGRHARLYQDGNRVLIEDLSSANGTFVNGQHVTQPTVVNSDDKIGLGSFTLILFVRGS